MSNTMMDYDLRQVTTGNHDDQTWIVSRLVDDGIEIEESERWLYNNPEALRRVNAGLMQARKGQLVDGPDLESDAQKFEAIS